MRPSPPAVVFGLATVSMIGLGLARWQLAPPPPPPSDATPDEPVPTVPERQMTANGFVKHPGDDALLLDTQRARLEQLATRQRRHGAIPRTRHLQPDGTPLYTNRLVESPSPYLQQHAHNPVNWFPWGDEAFERARALDRPILLSIGYATCHWCHIMEEESFEDPEVAAVINAHFVPIKVDRETRPDIDRIYMSAVTLSLGRGGWPATLVLHPDRRPFFAATYLPARDGDRGRSRGLLGLLAQIAQEWGADRERLEQFAEKLSAAVRQDLASPPVAGLPDKEAEKRVLVWARGRFDPEHGGLKGAPKFPSSLPVRLLLASDDQGARTMATKTLDGMAAGGIYDHVGGGFHRYSTDARWQVPHFEKMLYDNAQLARTYGEAFQLTGDLRYARVVEETLEAMIRDLGADGGGFCSALDADTRLPDGEVEEGRTYTWTPKELEEVLGDQAEAFQRVYGVTEAGNFEGRNVLHHAPDLPLATRDALHQERLQLLLARSERAQPLRDDKVLSSWNGLAIDALAYNGWLLAREDWLEEARDAAQRILDTRVDGRLQRLADEDGGTAFLSDYAFVSDGLISLFEATGERRWLDAALELVQVAETFHGDEGAWFRTPSDHEALLTRDKPAHDQPIPSANSVLVRVFVRLHALTGDERHAERAESIAAGLAIAERPAGFPNALLGLTARPLKEVVVVTERGERSSGLHAALKTLPPNRRVLVRQIEGEPALVGLAQGKVRLGAPTVYVCQQGVCDRPVTTPEELVELLK